MITRDICLVFTLSASAQAAPCPPFPPGVVTIGGVHHATAEANALRNSQDSVELAVAEASIASRVALHGHDEAPKAQDGELHGVTQTTCVVGKGICHIVGQSGVCRTGRETWSFAEPIFTDRPDAEANTPGRTIE